MPAKPLERFFIRSEPSVSLTPAAYQYNHLTKRRFYMYALVKNIRPFAEPNRI